MPGQQSSSKRSPAGLNNLPPGYVSFKHEGREFVIPEICLPHSLHAFAAHRTKSVFNIPDAEPALAPLEELEQTLMAGGLFQLPPNPLLSDQEKLALHAEVIALQAQLGISYKDAAHRLYMAEMEKLQLADKSAKAWRNLSQALKSSLEGRTVVPQANPEPAQPHSRGNQAANSPCDDDDEDYLDSENPEQSDPDFDDPDLGMPPTDPETFRQGPRHAPNKKQSRRGRY